MLIDIDLDLNMYLPVRLSFQNFFADGEVTFGGQSVSHKNEASSSTYSPKAGYIEASLCPNLSVFLIITDQLLGRSCAAVVEHSSRDHELEGLISVRCFFPFLFPFLPDFSLIINHRVSLVRSLKEVHISEIM